MTNYGTSDKINIREHSIQLKKMCLYDTTMTYIMRQLNEYNYAAGFVVNRTVIVGEYSGSDPLLLFNYGFGYSFKASE